MLKAKYWVFLFFMGGILSGYSQPTYSVMGAVYDSENQPLPYSVVILFTSSTDSVLQARYADAQGHFLFEDISAQDYYIVTEMASYKSDTLRFTLTKNEVLNITLMPNTLSEIVIVGNKPRVEQKIDRIVFHVENSLVAAGNSTWDLLKKTPGVRADESGNVTANGKSVAILLNGRLQKLSMEDLSHILKSMSAEDVSKIEVITNPPAKYDAEGGALINIVSVKNPKQGLNGNIRVGYSQSTYAKYFTGANWNYRNSKVNVYGNYTYRNGIFLTEQAEYIRYMLGTTQDTSRWNLSHRRVTHNLSNIYKAGVDYTLKEHHIVGVQVDGLFRNANINREIQTDIMRNQEHMDSTLRTENHGKNDIRQFSANLNYNGVLDTFGREVNIDMDFTHYAAAPSQELLTQRNIYGLGESTPLAARSWANQDIFIYSTNIDYAFPLKWDVYGEVGAKYTNLLTQNGLLFENRIEQIWQNDTTKTNRFEYKEQTEAAYLSFSKDWEKWSVKLGGRAEYTQSVGYSQTLNQKVNRQYFRIFPTSYIQYRLSDNHIFNLSYGKRIARPDYWRLNPFQYYTTPYSYLTGNPFLLPAIYHSYEFSYNFKQQYFVTLYYNTTQNQFSNITFQDNARAVLANTQVNIEAGHTYGVNLSLPFQISKSWESNQFFQLNRRIEASQYLQSSYRYSLFFLYFNTTQTFKLPHDFRVELSGWYASPGLQGIYNLGSNFDVSFALKKTFWKKNATVTASINDIFYQNIYRIKVNYLDQFNGFTERNDSRIFNLTFTYKFGNKQVENNRNRKMGNEDERNRVQK